MWGLTAAIIAQTLMEAHQDRMSRSKPDKPKNLYEPIDFESINTKEPKYGNIKYGGEQ